MYQEWIFYQICVVKWWLLAGGRLLSYGSSTKILEICAKFTMLVFTTIYSAVDKFIQECR